METSHNIPSEANTSTTGVNGLPSTEDVDSDEEVRRHTPSSVSRTKPGPELSAKDEKELESLKQKITYESDDDDGDDNTSVPSLKVEETDKHSLSPSVPSSLNDSREREPDVDSQKVSIEDVLDRLETVRSYAQDARSLYQQLIQKQLEPGVAEQMNKVSSMISQLKLQELSYLQVLLTLMKDKNVDPSHLEQLELLMNEGDTHVTDDTDSDDDNDDGAGSNDSMSLKAEIKIKADDGDVLDNEMGVAEHKRELEALQEQRTLLLKLREQQDQLETLRNRQSQLLKLKKEAEERLSQAEKQCDALGNVSYDGSVAHNESLPSADPSSSDHGGDSDRERSLRLELEKLKERKQQAEKLMEHLSSVKDGASSSKSAPGIVTTATKSSPRDEIVHSDVYSLQAKMKQIEDARRKMRELQEMVGKMQEMTTGRTDDLSKGGVATKKDARRNPPPTNEETHDDEVIQLLADYERNIGKKQRELEAIKQKKEELKQVEDMLRELQIMSSHEKGSVPDDDTRHYADGEGDSPSNDDDDEDVGVALGCNLSNELSKQQLLYDELKRKTIQLKQLQQEIDRLNDHDSVMGDTTIATWGGSSVTSVLSTAMDEEHRETTGHGDNPVNHLPQYHVDRHTPRQTRPVRRAYSPTDDPDLTIGKKIKLEPPGSNGKLNSPSSSKKQGAASNQTPSVQQRSAIWPSVIFSQSATRGGTAGKVQTPPSFSRPKGGVTAPVSSVPGNLLSSGSAPVAPPTPNDYVQLLQQQLANSSAMCFQLMDHQSSLLQALNQKLDSLPQIHEQMLQLHQYHDHLQGYHEYLNGAYWHLMDTSGGKDDLDASVENKNDESAANPSPSKRKNEGNSYLENPFSAELHPPNLPPTINSPFQRPQNPHLQGSSPDIRKLLPFPRALNSGFLSPYSSNIHVPSKKNRETQCEVGLNSAHPLEVDSTSSLPDRSTVSSGKTQFDKMRETIYSEVAALIAGNEERPHYLIELFKNLQLLNTDYLRQRVLYSIQDLVARFLKTEDNLALNNADESHDEIDSSANLSSEEDGGASISVPAVKRTSSQIYDDVIVVDSATSISSTPNLDPPFASDTLGDTVVKASEQPLPNNAPLDTQALDEEIKSVMTNVIPLLKSHLPKLCDTPLLASITKEVVKQVLKAEAIQDKDDLGLVFTEQLQVSLLSAVEKYNGKILKECGEDLLVDVSEVLFNEIAFFRLIKGSEGLSGKDYSQGLASGSQTNSDMESVTNSPLRPMVSSAILQSLGSVISHTLNKECESLGNNRDDELAKTWSPTETKSDKSDKAELMTMVDGEDGYVNIQPSPVKVTPPIEVATPPPDDKSVENKSPNNVE